MTLASQDSSFAERLVYLTGIPTDASEQEVTDLVGSFGKINNVILMPCSEEESEKGEGQKVLNKCNIMVIFQVSRLLREKIIAEQRSMFFLFRGKINTRKPSGKKLFYPFFHSPIH